MSFGLQVWDEAGRVNVNVTTRLTRFVGIFETTSSLSWRFVPVSGMKNDGTWGAVVTEIHYSLKVVEGGFQIKGRTDYPWEVHVLVFRY